MSKFPFVSVMVPFYNAEKTLSKCLNSIKNQTYKKIEIVAVDDGSKDNSIKLIKEFQKNSKIKFKIINLKHSGITGKVYNTGLKNCKGEWVLKLDADMWLDEKYIELIVKEFSEEYIGYQGTWGIDPEKKYSTIEKLYIVNRLGNLLYEDKINHPGAQMYKNIPGLKWGEITYGEDIIILNFLRKSGKLKTVPKAKIYHQEPKTFIENIKQWSKYGKYKYRSLKRNGGFNVLLSEIYFLIPILILLSIFFPYIWIITGILLVYLLNRLIIKTNLALRILNRYSGYNLIFYVLSLLGLKIVNSYVTLFSLIKHIFKKS
jgi:glycosyltransferase involved in cell wall biosynthesis